MQKQSSEVIQKDIHETNDNYISKSIEAIIKIYATCFQKILKN